ncbi:MAG TPA: peptidoglycan DD-metalloendopeptidase family protein [Candidatus Udaeobacter sp.]|nr:peptidoglycan DD-metalloendopeptidase family protein [Candidatus Udaeobacter sp.]
MQPSSRVAVAERGLTRYSIASAFALAFLGLAASLGPTASLFDASRRALSISIEIPTTGDIDQQLAQRYFLLPTAQVDSDAAAPAPQPADIPDTPAAPSPIEQIVQVQKGDTLLSLLTDAGVKMDEAHAAIAALRDVYSPRKLQIGQPIKLTLLPNDPSVDATDGDPQAGLQLMGISLQSSVAQNVELIRGVGGDFVAEAKNVPLHRELARSAGVINSSLFEAGQADGVPIAVLSEVIHAFSYDVDFQRDFRPGDRYEILYQRYADGEGHLAKLGDVLFASLTLHGRQLSLYRFTSPDGRTDWFNPKGDSVRKALLRTPVDGAKITSGFGMRINPILGFSMMHKGVDFGAPVGTPIYAAGDGVVEQMGVVSGYGNYIRIKHTAKYATAYAHMSRYAGGIHVGSRVRQGQVIAYVGMTGRATGPHLHYEVLVDGKQINPQSIKLPTGEKLQGKELKQFQVQVANVDRERQDIARLEQDRVSFDQADP